MPPEIRESVRQSNTKDLLIALINKDLKVRYKNNVLGYTWSLLNPLAFAVVFYFTFKVVLKIPLENYALFLIIGLFPWQWAANSAGASSMLLIGNAPLLKKIKIPKFVLPLALVLQDMIHFIFTMPVILLFILVYDRPFHFLSWTYLLPALLLPQFLITLGVSLIISAANVFLRDIERLVGIFTLILFHATPIFYSETMVPDKFKLLLILNPMATLVINWRNMFLTGAIDVQYYLISLAHSLLLMAIGYGLYKKYSWKFPELV